MCELSPGVECAVIHVLGDVRVYRTVRPVYLPGGGSRVDPIVEIPAQDWDALLARVAALERERDHCQTEALKASSECTQARDERDAALRGKEA